MMPSPPVLTCLRSVVRSGDVQVLLQPVVHLATGQVTGYEALVRGPAGTPLESPRRLFQAAAEADLELELDRVCCQAASRMIRYLQPGQRLFVNLTPRSVAVVGAATVWTHELLQWPDELRERIVLEIGEEQRYAGRRLDGGLLRALRASGYQLALDDLGSKNYVCTQLLDLRPQFIKLSPLLVQLAADADQEWFELLSFVVYVAHELGSQVVAEGIETGCQLRAVRRLGVDYGQGFFLGAPQPTPQGPYAAALRILEALA